MVSQSELQGIVTDSLQRLGLSDQEIAFYVLSLKVGPTSIADLATKLGVSRPQAYKLIDDLETRGLANFSSRKKFSRTFVVEPPTRIRDLLRKHQETVIRTDQALGLALPDLLALYQQGELPTSVKILEGRDQFVKLFFQIIEEAKDETCYFGSAHDFIGLISWTEDLRWIKERIQRGIKLRTLLLPSMEGDALKSKDAQENRETRFLKEAQPFVTSFQLFANKVILWQPKAPIAVLIEDAYLVQMLTSMFNLLWKQSV